MTSKELRKARLKLKLTQGELAEMLGVDMRTARRWEGDESPIPPLIDERAALTILRLHDALKKGS